MSMTLDVFVPSLRPCVLTLSRVQVTVADGRVLVGSFICLDQQGNIILDQTVERYQVNGMEKESMLGQVLIPRSQRVACEVEVVTAERSTIERLVQVT